MHKSNYTAFCAWILPLILLSACTQGKRQERTVPPAESARIAQLERNKGVGAHRAEHLTGDFQNDPQMLEFVTQMVERHGFSREYLYGLFSSARRKQTIVDYVSQDSGPVAGMPKPGAWTHYRAKFLTEPHIVQGAQFWNRHEVSLRRAVAQYGVPSEYIVAILGVETFYGKNMGKYRVLDALSTLAFAYPRRADFFRGELEKFLVMSQGEGIDPAQLLGSYAGAMGMGQFMPSSFLTWAVDFNGDGHRDLWLAEDAIGSVARYFSEHGWQSGAEVTTRASIGKGKSVDLEVGFETRYTLDQLAATGIQAQGAIPGEQSYSLLRLRAKRGDEYWLGHPNFYAITRYNHSTHYAMAVHELAQALRLRHAQSPADSR
jgi:membrane-bound lytic murein transglycosylase B